MNLSNKTLVKKERVHSEETRLKMSIASKGRKKSIAHRKSLSLAKIGKPSVCIGQKRPTLTGSNNPKWKGKNVSYRNLHRWVERQIGKPNKCSDCGGIGYGRRMHWANRSGSYKRELTDWIRLCASCHGEYDKKNSLRARKKLKA